MMHDYGIGALLRLQVKAFGEPHADILLGLEQAEDFGLVFQIRAGRIAERITRTAVLLVKKIGDPRRVFARDA